MPLRYLETELNEAIINSLRTRRAYVLETSIEKAEKDIRSLRCKIEEAGDIDMTSIEESDKYKQRYEFLSRQIENLEASKKELVEIITQLDEKAAKFSKKLSRKFGKTSEKLPAAFQWGRVRPAIYRKCRCPRSRNRNSCKTPRKTDALDQPSVRWRKMFDRACASILNF